MKKIYVFSIAIILFSGCAVFKPATIPLDFQYKKYTIETVYSKSSKLNYVISLPKNYDANNDNYPVIVNSGIPGRFYRFSKVSDDLIDQGLIYWAVLHGLGITFHVHDYCSGLILCCDLSHPLIA